MTDINYSSIVKNALRSVLREALLITQKNGLPELHHFYISVDTTHQNVNISKTLLALYPKEITIVIQHQFWDLDVHDDYFNITLSFNGVKEKLFIPFNSVKTFSDPFAKFALQFDEQSNEKENDIENITEENSEQKANKSEKNKALNIKKKNDDNIITLDSFRNK